MLPIKEENGEHFSKIVTKESSMANPSFRVYYGGNSVAVPFMWEAKPGTPKHVKHGFCNEEENKEYLPPLTPPPSYYLKQPNKLPSSSSGGSKKFSSKIFLGFLLPRSLHRRQISTTSSLSSSSSVTSSSTLSCPSSSRLVSDSTMRGSEDKSRSLSLSLNLSLSRGGNKRRTLSSPGSLFDFLVNAQEDDEHEDDVRSSPRSVLCFGFVGSRRIRTCSVV